jgi:hypothetical protein
MKSVKRRTFLKGAGAVMVSSLIPWPISCVPITADPNQQLTPELFQTLVALQNH